MSQTDSFIEEVTEEVRREKLYGYLRRYGWIGIAIVVLVVGGAAYNEYRKAQIRSAAEARGDAIVAALDSSYAESRLLALQEIPDPDAAAPVVAMLAAAEAQTGGDPFTAAEMLKEIEGDQSVAPIYRDMALFKRVILLAQATPPESRIEQLQPLTAPGAPFRVLALEQIALAEVEQGKIDAALTRLRALLDDSETSPGLRRRASQLIVALGGETEPA